MDGLSNVEYAWALSKFYLPRLSLKGQPKMARSISYALRVLAGRFISFRDRACPYCESTKTHAVGLKHIILQLRICEECGLRYRFPKDNPYRAVSFYQDAYREPTVTDLPALEEVPRLVARGFKGSCFEKSDKVDFIMSRLGPCARDSRILDYGASFGYMMSQLRFRGAKHLLGFEISKKRARFGKKYLGEEILSNLQDVLSHPFCPFDVVLASHVLEHLARIRDALDFFKQVVRRPAGRLFIWVPNASHGALDRFHKSSWAPLVGETHSVAFDYDFFRRSLPRHGFRIIETGDPSAAELTLVAEAE